MASRTRVHRLLEVTVAAGDGFSGVDTEAPLRAAEDASSVLVARFLILLTMISFGAVAALVVNVVCFFAGGASRADTPSTASTTSSGTTSSSSRASPEPEEFHNSSKPLLLDADNAALCRW